MAYVLLPLWFMPMLAVIPGMFAGVIYAIDLATQKVVETWPLDHKIGPYVPDNPRVLRLSKLPISRIARGHYYSNTTDLHIDPNVLKLLSLPLSRIARGHYHTNTTTPRIGRRTLEWDVSQYVDLPGIDIWKLADRFSLTHDGVRVYAHACELSNLVSPAAPLPKADVLDAWKEFCMPLHVYLLENYKPETGHQPVDTQLDTDVEKHA